MPADVYAGYGIVKAAVNNIKCFTQYKGPEALIGNNYPYIVAYSRTAKC